MEIEYRLAYFLITARLICWDPDNKKLLDRFDALQAERLKEIYVLFLILYPILAPLVITQSATSHPIVIYSFVPFLKATITNSVIANVNVTDVINQETTNQSFPFCSTDIIGTMTYLHLTG